VPYDNLALLVVGSGSIGSRHARNLRALGVGRLAVYDPDSARTQRLAGELGVEVAGSVEAGLDARPDAVVVCTPSGSHLPVARRALASGAHVFVEKPLAASLAEVPEFVAEAEASGRAVMVGYNLRFHPVLRQVADWLDRAPAPASARLHLGEWLPGRHPGEDYRLGYGARRDLGGGVLLDAIHELDYAIWLFGWPRRVFAMGGHVSDLEIDTDDLAEILLGYDGGTTVSVHLDYLQRPRARTCQVIGNGWSVRADLNERTARFDAPGAEAPERFAAEDTIAEDYVREMDEFLRCVTGDATPTVDAGAGAASLVLAEAARQSIESGQPVTLKATPADALRSQRVV
jgi:predicted dehydrogenase